MLPSSTPSRLPPIPRFKSSFSLEGDFEPKRNNQVAVISKWPTDYELSFTINPWGTEAADWNTIIHLTNGIPFPNYQSRMPAVYFSPGGTRLHIWQSVLVSAGNDHKFLTWAHESQQLLLNTETRFRIGLVGETFNVDINGTRVHNAVSINQPPVLGDVKVYLGEPNYPAAKAVISNITFVDLVSSIWQFGL